MMKKGVFITFEGSEGCGKSTQSQLLADYLRSRGCAVVLVREPGGTHISEQLRQVLLDGRNAAMAAECEMLLYMAARAQIVSQIIRPALQRGAVVICDRFLDSTLAYQGYGLGMDVGLIQRIGAFATGGLRPDLTLLMDLPVKDGLKHRESSQDRIERRPLAYHIRVRRGYRALAQREPRRIKVIKVEREKETTQERIRAVVRDVIRFD